MWDAITLSTVGSGADALIPGHCKVYQSLIRTFGLVLTSGSSSASHPPSCRSTTSSYPDPSAELVRGKPSGRV